MKPISCIVVDDEPLARNRISSLLAQDNSIQLIAECANGKIALEQIEKQTPDILFVDIQMPEMTGFELVEAIGTDKIPAIVFVTAYDEFALKAFEVHAIDYILKPFEAERFFVMLERAKQLVIDRFSNDINVKIQNLIQGIQSAEKKYVKRIMIKGSDRVVFMDTSDIDYIESSGNYVKIFSEGKHKLVRDTLANMQSNLNPDEFFRIHRSIIVNINKVKELQSWFHGDYMVILHDGTKLNMSRNYKEILSHK